MATRALARGRTTFLISHHVQPLRYDYNDALAHLTHSVSNPYELAEQNASYAFTYAKQFARHSPFMLVFVVHPWFSGGWLHNEFGNFIRDFQRAFARRTFLQFQHDATPVFDVTKGAAAGMLSGLAFFNARRGQPQQPGTHFRLFVNPLASNPISDLTLDELRFGFSAQHDLEIVRFDHDVY